MKIVSVGETTIDHYRKQDRYYVGGISLNFAVHAKRSGAETASLVSCVGNRPVDARVLELLAVEGVDHSQVAVLEGKTAECAIDVYENADRVFPAGGYHEHVLSQLSLTDDVQTFINQHDVVVTMFDGDQPSSIVTQLVRMPKGEMRRVMDFGDWSNGRSKKVPADLYSHLDLAFFSGDMGTLEYLLPLTATYDCQFVLTLGAQGSLALTADGLVSHPALPVDALVDSTGCGDAFQAAFTVSYFNSHNLSPDQKLAQALAAGAKQAAGVLQYFGAFDQLALTLPPA